jgi:AP-3 complex subunit mu
VRWIINRIPKEKLPLFSGNLVTQPGTQPEGNPVVSADFKINLFSASGLKVDGLQLLNEDYKPYKGVKSITQAGKFQIRT